MTTQARELAKLVSNSGDLNFIDDIALGSDGAVLTFGADSEITLTHVHNNGLLLNSTKQLQFGDSGTYIHQSADGVLDLVSDTEIELNATTIDINGAVDVSGTVTAPNFTGTASLATAITITANNTADETVFPVFVDGATGTQGLETDTGFTYNPNTNTLSVVNLSVSGTNTIVDSVTMNASNAVIFEGSSADAHETTLTSANATADRTITLPNLTGTVSLLDASETLTNKTLTSPVISTITGSTITLDSAGDIVLDAGGADVAFKDDGTQIGTLTNSSTDFVIASSVSDKDLIFKGNDGGSVITALTLDMSDAGTAIFNNKVGIGTASPRGLLEVGNAAGTTDVDQKLYITGDQVNASGNFATLVLSNSNRSGSSSSQISAGRDVDNIGTTLQFYTHPTSGSETERLRIDSSGRILIAATAAAVHANVDDLQVGNGVGNRGIGIHSANNANGAIFFSDTDSTLSGQIEYVHNGDNMAFVTASSTRMIILGDGNVVIGGTAALGGAKLSIDHSGASIIGADTSASGGGYIQLLAGGTAKGLLGFGSNSGASSINSVALRSQSGHIEFQAGGATEMMRVLSTGELHITSGGGAISPTIKHGQGDVAKLRLINRSGQGANKGGVLELGGVTDDGVSRSDVFASLHGGKDNSTSGNKAGYLDFHTSNGSSLDRRMRLTSNGELLMGDTALRGTNQRGQIQVTQISSSNAAGISCISGNDEIAGTFCLYSSGTASSMISVDPDSQRASSAFYVWIDGSERMSLNSSGNLYVTGSYSNSDRALKENIVTLPSQLETVKQLNPVSFDWKAKAEDGSTESSIGFIAQEVETLYPILVTKPAEDTEAEQGSKTKYKTLNYAVMTSILTKAMQEQQTIIEDLKSRLDNAGL